MTNHDFAKIGTVSKKDTLTISDREGKKINLLQIKFMRPFLDKQTAEFLHHAKNLLLIENNYSAQLGSLIREQTGVEIKDKLLRYDGKTFTVDEIYEELKKRC